MTLSRELDAHLASVSTTGYDAAGTLLLPRNNFMRWLRC